jgi:hypothetical protein
MMAPNAGDDSEYIANVPQTNIPTASEETCCQKIYGDPSAANNPHLDPDAKTTTPAPTQPPATTGPCVGVFISNDGSRHLQLKPWKIGTFWVYGAYTGGLFKMVSVDQAGKKIQARYSKTSLTNSMSPSQLQTAWNAAARNTDASNTYSVEVTLGDTSKPPPVLKESPQPGDAEGSLYFSNGDLGGRRSSIRRRMRGTYYAIAPEVSFKLVKKGAQCRSKNKYYGCWLRTAADCAKKVKKEGKKFFIYYGGSAKLSYHDKKCYGEGTTSEACPEGFSSTGYNGKYSFYSVLA